MKIVKNTIEIKTSAGIDQLIEMGMREPKIRRKVLLCARRMLKQEPITVNVFKAAMNIIESLGKDYKKWLPLVEAACERLSETSKLRVRLTMLSYHTVHQNYNAARKFFPKKFRGEFGPFELGMVMEGLLKMNCLGEAEMLIPKCRYAAKHLVGPALGTILLCSMGDYFKQIGNWDAAMKYYQEANQKTPGFKCAMWGMAGTQAARALETVRKGIKQVRKIRQQTAPDTNQDACHYDTDEYATTLYALEKLEEILVKAVPKRIGESIR